ncbi:hypothetical protein GGG16DRAFT_119246 [Schizophyllum commune]
MSPARKKGKRHSKSSRANAKTPQRRRGRPPVDPLNWQTPKGPAPDKRDHHAKSKVVALVGQLICLITGWVTLPYLLQCVHIVPRTLHRTHEDWYDRLRESVGIFENGKRDLNLDNTGNQDIFHLTIHKIWDGPGMFPKVSYTFGLYSMSAKPKHVIGLYSNEPRKYDHIVKNERTLQAMRKEDCEGTELFHSIDVEDDTEASRQLGPEYQPPNAPTPSDTSNTPVTHILTVGVQESIRIVSHLNPVFVIWDYALKMLYRCYTKPELADELPQEDVIFFKEEIWPVVGHWFMENPESLFTGESDDDEDSGNSEDEEDSETDDDYEADEVVDLGHGQAKGDRRARLTGTKTDQPTTGIEPIPMSKRPAKTSVRFGAFPKASSDSSDISDRSATPCPPGISSERATALGGPGSTILMSARHDLDADAAAVNAHALESIPEDDETEGAQNRARSPSEGPFQTPADSTNESTTRDKASRIDRYAAAIGRKAKSIGFTVGKRISDRTTLKGTSSTFKASTVQFGHSANQDPPGTEPSAWRASDIADAEGEPTDGSAPNSTSTDPPGASDATAAGPSTAGPSVPQPITRPRRSQPKRNYKEASSSDGFSDAGDDVDNPPPKRLRMKPPAPKGTPAKKGAPAKKKGRG